MARNKNSRQSAVGSGQYWQPPVGSRQSAPHSRQWAVGSGQFTEREATRDACSRRSLIAHRSSLIDSTGERRGVILLVVMVLLALFTMMMLAYVVSTTNSLQAVSIGSKADQTGDPPETLLREAFLQAVRGPRDNLSVMGPHSLLEDIYGYLPGVINIKGKLSTAVDSNGNQIHGYTYYFPDSANSGNPNHQPYLPNGVTPGGGQEDITTYNQNHTPILGLYCATGDLQDTRFNIAAGVYPPYGFYNGLVITMLTGPAAGRSSRIVGYYYNSDTTLTAYPVGHQFQVLDFDGVAPQEGDQFLINGRAFSGTGYGFNPGSFTTTRLLDAADASFTAVYDSGGTIITPQFQPPFALLLNPRRGVFNPNGPYFDPAGLGGANEDYDAVDFQNPLLAMRVWSQPWKFDARGGSTALAYQLMTPLPSLHRPDLLNYWNNEWVNVTTGSDLISDVLGPPFGNSANKIPANNLLRKIVLRPLPIDHPNFTGSNPYFDINNPVPSPYNINQDPALGKYLTLTNLMCGPWDIDNDGDGVPDSIWVDFGFPVQTAPDGRRYKPLVAVLCIDMDGKLNLNAHSHWWHVPPTDATTGLNDKTVPTRFDPLLAPFAQTNPNSPQMPILKIGSGYGPPEISLSPIFEPYRDNGNNANLNATGDLARLLGGLTLPNPTAPSTLINGRYGEVEIGSPRGMTQSPYPGISGIDDVASWVRELDYPQILKIGTTNNFPHSQNNYLPTSQSWGNFTNAPATWIPSAFGSPNDLDGDGMKALDFRGQPLYIDFAGLPNRSIDGGSQRQSHSGHAGWGESDDTIDDPYELDLSLNAPGGYSSSVAYPKFGTNYLAANNFTTNRILSDTPFTAAELEPILRHNDWDASTLPDRIIRLASVTFLNNPAPANPYTGSVPSGMTTGRYPYFPEFAQLPNQLTTHSIDVPTPNMTFTSPELVTKLATNGPGINATFNSHISQLLVARINYEPTASGGGTPPTQYNMTVALSQLLSPDLLGGEKLNINRPLGNGQDDDWVPSPPSPLPAGYGIVDDPGEIQRAGEYAWKAIDTVAGTGAGLDLDNDGLANGPSDMYARQALARHLYVLMMLLKDDLFSIQADLNGDGQIGPVSIGGGRIVDVDTAYYFAQLAVNMVDFRDADSIITPFEFDVDPFYDNSSSPGLGITWDVDGILTSTVLGISSADDNIAGYNNPYRGLVWGCERPELLITETMAAHDRRTADTMLDDGIKKAVNRDPMTPGDMDFDQVRRPQGTMLIELYNPNSPMAVGNKIGGQVPNEFYTTASNYPPSNSRPPRTAGAVTQNAGYDESGAPLYGVNLGAVNTFSAPAWRIAILSADAAAQLSSTTPQSGASVTTPVALSHPPLPLPPAWQKPPGVFNPGTSTTSTVPPLRGAVIPTKMQGVTTNNLPVIDRVVYFSQQVPTQITEGVQRFCAQAGTFPVIPPNRYAVIGPAASDAFVPSGLPSYLPGTGLVVHMGARDKRSDTPNPTSPTATSAPTKIFNIYPRRIQLLPMVDVYDDVAKSDVGAYASPGSDAPALDIKPAIGVPIASLALAGNRSLRFSISEPSRGYPTTNPVITGANVGDENAFYASPYPDQPFDQDTGNQTFSDYSGTSQSKLETNRQTIVIGGAAPDGGINADQTIPQYTIVYLQRLANPAMAWDANANPYIIVDQMWVDLTCYNSEKDINPSSGKEEFTKSAGGMLNHTSNTFSFDSRQRGPDIPANDKNLLTQANIWFPYGVTPAKAYIQDNPVGAGQPPLPSGVNNVINPLANSTWGYLNSTYSSNIYWNGNPYNNSTNQYGISGLYDGSTAPSGTKIDVHNYYGDTVVPFPWLTWNNRPYISAKELMLVPTGSPASMLSEMTSVIAPSIPPLMSPPIWPGLNTGTPYDQLFNSGTLLPINPATPLAAASPLPKGEFGYLANFYHSPQYSYIGAWIHGQRTNPSLPLPSPNLFRLLEYLGVPSRFVGTETWLPAPQMQGNNPWGPTASYSPALPPVHMLHPPFNRVSQFREPGKVNINTIFDPIILQGILDERDPYSYYTFGTPQSKWAILWNMICASRQRISSPSGTSNLPIDANGYPLSLSKLPPTTIDYPSIFATPFRSYAGRTLVPRDSMRIDPTSNVHREIDGTLLRATADSTQGIHTYPLLEYPGVTGGGQWFENNGVQLFDEPTRNPDFAYKTHRRLDNLLTTRSNVYAVWITVGYFEVTPAPTSDPQRNIKYPDGWVLGQEIGSDTGDIKRNRAFYMYDRSIPVGFERGENHNVENGILLERFIE